MDGGSTDCSVSIIKQYEDRLHYWRSARDGGQSAATAEGFARSTGEILCWLNSDDILLAGALRHVATMFVRRQEVGFVYGNRLLIDENGSVIGKHKFSPYVTRWHWAEGQPMGQEACFWRRTLYDEAGGLDPSIRYILDYDLFYRMWERGRFLKTGRYLGAARMHKDSKTSNLEHVWRRELAAAVEKYGLKRAGPIRARLKNRTDRLMLATESYFWGPHQIPYP
jgi:glycosyltransferase involved in cell wall biosynthesis